MRINFYEENLLGKLPKELLQETSRPYRGARRSHLTRYMSDLIEQKKDCFSCVGHCCTSSHNSMRVTPLEALDMVRYLIEKDRLSSNLIKQLQENVKHYRLDKEIFTKNNQELRRYYTCPFYAANNLGCTIGKYDKPYGCLAFNPRDIAVSEAGSCKSYTEVLEVTQNANENEEKLNEMLRDLFNIPWQKKPIPNAILFLIEKLSLP